GGVATIGRALDCTVVVDERDVSRKHAKIESTPDGLLLTDLGSSTGVWIGSTEVKSQLIRPGDRVRLGEHVLLECALVGAAPVAAQPVDDPFSTRFISAADVAAIAPPPPAAPPPAVVEDSNATRMIPFDQLAASMPAPPAPASPDATSFVPAAKVAAAASPDATSYIAPEKVAKPAPAAAKPAAAVETPKGSPLDNEGELSTFLAHKPIVLDDPSSVSSVVSGGVLIFTVAIENGEPAGTRTHFLGVNPGQCFFGFDLKAYGFGSGFLAVAKQGTQVRKIPRTRLREIAADRTKRAGVAKIVDDWVNGLSTALIHDFPAKRADE